MELSYHQILAEVYDENAKNLLVHHNEFQEDEDREEHEEYDYEGNELPNPEEFNKFHGDRNKPEHVIKPDPKEHNKHKRPEVRTIVLNIDGAFRGNIVPNTDLTCTGNPAESNHTGTSSSHFTFLTNKIYRNITSVKLTSMEFANTFYTFSANRGNTTFTLSNGTNTYNIQIDNGNFTPAELASHIATKLTAPITITYNSNTHKFTFNNATGYTLTFPSNDTNPYGNGIGYNLGFIYKTYNITGTTLDSDQTPNTTQDTYVYLQINDWNLLEHQQYGQTFYSVFAKIQLTGPKNAIIFDNNYTNSSTKEYVFPQPVNLQKFEIRMLDAYGNTLDLRNGSFSMTIELQQVNSSAVYEDLLKL